ncbi:MAG TPA: hypothetical protein PKB02_00395 [Anaerohalosphaeraceae bacterium]|jgi:hypothetical protein|nr:hypothetical protein [Anaerohalosphaeraceae bacterium]
MSKRELIDCILEINRTAKPEFLAQFSSEDLDKYLENLLGIEVEDYALCA